MDFINAIIIIIIIIIGIIPLCQNGHDKFIFLYFGLSLNLMVLLMNTHYRYQRIAGMPQHVRTRDVLLKNWLVSRV